MQRDRLARRVAIPLHVRPDCTRPPAGELHRIGGPTMGTSWSVTYADLRARTHLLQVVSNMLAVVIRQMSTWEPTSVVSRINATAGRSAWHDVPTEFATVLSCALRIAAETGGAYDPAVGRLVDLWGFGPPGRRGPPSSSELKTAHVESAWKRVEFDAPNGRVRLREGARLDLSSIAKGFAVDLVAQALRRDGIDHCLVEIGGELRGAGVKPDGLPWWVRIDPGYGGLREERHPLVALHDLSIATSGSERSFTARGQRYCHTIDPRTGMPIDNGTISASVLHPSCMEADGYATAMMVMRPDEAMAFADRHQLAVALLHETDADAPAERISTALAQMIDED